ncbi:hypothetical protein BH23ACT10_BH23ACT10_34090 [soil metagenome]
MFVLTVVGAAVLAFVSWACLREAQRMSTSFIPDRRTAVRVDRSPPQVIPGYPELAGPAPASPPRIRALGDATVPDADTDEALAAAAALWQVVVHTERG